MTRSGPVAGVLGLFLKLIAATFCMTLLLLLFQFTVAGLARPQNPLRMLRTMLAAYVTALGTQSSAATIPVTLSADAEARRASRAGLVRHPALRHDPSFGFDAQDYGLRPWPWR